MYVKVTIDAPDKLFDFPTFERTLIQGQDRLTAETADDFALTCSTFKKAEDKPKITVEKTKREGDTYKSAAVATGDVYYYLNNGTERHYIPLTPKTKGFLKFPDGRGFISKTNPGTIMPSGGANTGSDVFMKQVDHPGTKARNFDDAIAAKHKDDLAPVALAAIDAGLKAAK